MKIVEKRLFNPFSKKLFWAVALSAGVSAASAAVPTDFAKGIEITSAVSSGSGTLTNFPVLVRLSTSITGFSYGDFQLAGGGDLMFTDTNGVILAHEVDTWNASGTSLVWVKVPELSQGTKIRAYYGNGVNPGVTPSATWSGYVGVWHMGEASGNCVDSAGNGLTAVPTGANSADSVAYGSAPIGAGRQFATAKGNKTYLLVANNAKLDMSNTFTVSGWFKASNTFAQYSARYCSRKGKWDGTDGFEFEQSYDNSATVAATKVSARGANNGNLAQTVPNITQNWLHLMVCYNGTNLQYYVNGQKGSAYSTLVEAKDNDLAFTIGNNPTGGEANWVGWMDEFRLYDGVVSADYAAAECAVATNASAFSYGSALPTDPTAAAITAGPTLSRDENGTVALAATVSGTTGTTYRIFAVCNDVFTNEIDAAWMPTEGNLTTNILFAANVPAGSTYAVKLYADNGISTASAACAESFLAGDVSAAKGADAVENGLVPGTFLVSRPAGSDQQPLVVNYTITSATATPGVSYEIPAGAAVSAGNTITGSVTIAQGATNATVSVKPKNDVALQSDATIAFSLTSGLYGIASGAPSATLTLVNLVSDPNFNTWVAPSAGKASVAGNWSYGRPPIATDNILFDGRFSTRNCEWDVANGGGVATVASWTQMADFTGTNSFNTTFAAADTTLTNLVITGDCILSNGVWTHPAATAATHAIATNYYHLAVKVGGRMELAAAAKIDVSGKGCWAQGAYTGGSYGGQADFGAAYGSVLEPSALGSSNGADGGAVAGTLPAFGGGALWLDVAGAFAMNGPIASDGIRTYSGWNISGGSGGSVYVKAASLSGTGTVSANGLGMGGSNCNNAGSGGRISILLTGAAALGVPEANLTAYGSSVYSHVAGAGTVVIRTTTVTNGRLIVRDAAGKYGSYAYYPTLGYMTPILAGQTWTFDSIAFGANGILYVPTGTTLALPNGLSSVEAPSALGGARTCGLLISGGTLDIPATSKHTISGPWTFGPNGSFALTGDVAVTNGAAIGVIRMRPTATNAYTRLDLTVHGNVSVSSNSYLLADNAGLCDSKYFAGTSAGDHGGAYGCDTYATNVFGYDSILSPALPGNAGSSMTRVGGGVLKMKVDGTLSLNGSATAGITDGGHWYGGSGTINLTAGKLEGSGRISVTPFAGGKWDDQNNYHLYPGGGRVSVRLTDNGATFTEWWRTNTFARGVVYNAGDGTRLHHSSAGTVYLQDAIQGEGAGTVYIAQNGLSINWTMACTNDLTAFPSTRHGGELDVLDKVTLDISGGAHTLLTRNTKIRDLNIATNSTMELNGKTLTVTSAKVGGTKLASGQTYSASNPAVAAYLDDATGTGSLVVKGFGFVMVVR